MEAIFYRSRIVPQSEQWRAETVHRGSGVYRAEKGTFGVADSICRSVPYPLKVINTKGGNDLPPEAFVPNPLLWIELVSKQVGGLVVFFQVFSYFSLRHVISLPQRAGKTIEFGNRCMSTQSATKIFQVQSYKVVADHIFFVFQDSICLYKPDYPGTRSVDQVGHELRDSPAPTTWVLGFMACAPTPV